MRPRTTLNVPGTRTKALSIGPSHVTQTFHIDPTFNLE